MNADPLPSSPLGPEEPSIHTAESVPEPVAPQEPRLAIVHLLVWTACVALLLGIDRLWSDQASTTRPLWMKAVSALYALGQGAALGGLILWAARRRRGLVFPRFPGEHLLIVQGLLAVVGVVIRVAFVLEGGVAIPHAYGPVQILLCVSPLAGAAFFLWLALRVRVPRWQGYFLLQVVACLLHWAFWCGGIHYYVWSYSLSYLVPTVVLAAVAWVDWRQHLRYPWTHWLAVFISLWSVVVYCVQFVGQSLWR